MTTTSVQPAVAGDLAARLSAASVQRILYPLVQRLNARTPQDEPELTNYTALAKAELVSRILATWDSDTILAELDARPAESAQPALPSSDKATAALAALKAALGSQQIDAEQVEKMVAAALERERDAIVKAALEAATGAGVSRIVVENRTGAAPSIVDVGVQHERFPRLLRTVTSRDKDGHLLAAWLYGPAGTGKTSAGIALARSLGKRFRMSGKLDSEFGVLGFIQPSLTGVDRCVRTEFREAYEHGDVWLWDEADRSSPAAAAALHAALANGHCAFPDAVIPRHPEFRCIVGANTFGAGNSADYSAAVRQDRALLDRFVPIFWGIDERMEAAKCVTGTQGARWLAAVRAARATANARGMRDRITPRATVKGCALLENGADFAECCDMLTADAETSAADAIRSAARGAWDGAA